jgi:hypothetical protein
MPPHCDSLDGPVVGAARSARSYTSAMLGFQVWAHSMHLAATRGVGHGEAAPAGAHAH